MGQNTPPVFQPSACLAKAFHKKLCAYQAEVRLRRHLTTKKRPKVVLEPCPSFVREQNELHSPIRVLLSLLYEAALGQSSLDTQPRGLGDIRGVT